MKKLNVQHKDSDKVLGVKKSLFVSFNYDMETVDRIKRLPIRYYNSSSREWEIPTRHLNQFINTFQDYNIILHGPVETRIENSIEKVAKFERVNYSDVSYKTKPYPHQAEGVNYGLENSKFILGDEQGLGKTKQAIDLAIARKHQFDHCLIVCGVNSLKYNWVNEIKTHSDEECAVLGARKRVRGKNKGKWVDGPVKDRVADLKAKNNSFFLITNIESLRSKEMQKLLQEKTLSGEIGMVVIDEIHKAKNYSSTQGKAIHNLRSFYKMALSGTALMNSPIDLYNVLRWLDEEQNSLGRFKQRYCIYGGFGGYEIVDYKNLEDLRLRLDSVQLRRKKEEVLDLPPKIRTTEYVELTGKQKLLYEEVKESALLELEEILIVPNPLARLLRLRQVTSNPRILNPDITESAKLERLKELVSEIASNDRKVVIFSEWEQVTREAREVLKEFNPAYVVGDADTEAEKTKFKTDTSCKAIIGTRAKLGTGHTLTEASYVIFVDKPWNLANTEQAEDRAHRIGTTETVNVISLVAKDSIDENIEKLIEKKGNLGKALVDSEFGDLDKMDRRELIELLLA